VFSGRHARRGAQIQSIGKGFGQRFFTYTCLAGVERRPDTVPAALRSTVAVEIKWRCSAGLWSARPRRDRCPFEAGIHRRRGPRVFGITTQQYRLGDKPVAIGEGGSPSPDIARRERQMTVGACRGDRFAPSMTSFRSPCVDHVADPVRSFSRVAEVLHLTWTKPSVADEPGSFAKMAKEEDRARSGALPTMPPLQPRWPARTISGMWSSPRPGVRLRGHIRKRHNSGRIVFAVGVSRIIVTAAPGRLGRLG